LFSQNQPIIVWSSWNNELSCPSKCHPLLRNHQHSWTVWFRFLNHESDLTKKLGGECCCDQIFWSRPLQVE
jgi:hypothetical protein